MQYSLRNIEELWVLIISQSNLFVRFEKLSSKNAIENTSEYCYDFTVLSWNFSHNCGAMLDKYWMANTSILFD